MVIDEFGAMRKNTGDLQDRVNFTAYYAASASARGITCAVWDNSNLNDSGEVFCLIDRNRVEWVYPEIAQALVENALFGREE